MRSASCIYLERPVAPSIERTSASAAETRRSSSSESTRSCLFLISFLSIIVSGVTMSYYITNSVPKKRQWLRLRRHREKHKARDPEGYAILCRSIGLRSGPRRPGARPSMEGRTSPDAQGSVRERYVATPCRQGHLVCSRGYGGDGAKRIVAAIPPVDE